MRNVERILVYTHNSIGLGHAVRTMAVIDGMRAALPQTDFLVLSGGSAPGIFLTEGVETVKLPGLRHCLETAGQPFRPRYLHTLGRDEVLAWRSRLIAETLSAFRPGVVMLEHSLAGLMGEGVPLLAKARALDPDGHLLVHLSRGIYCDRPKLLAPCAEYPGLPSSLCVTALYDAFFVLEEHAVVDVNQEFFGDNPALESRIHYLGKITAKNPEELLARPGGLEALGLREPLALLSLGRHGPVRALHARLFAALERLPLFESGMVLVVLDPYLSKEETQAIKALPHPAQVRFTPFFPMLSEAMRAASLVVCRAGYNTVNELLLTARPALVIPEGHPSREQERRAANLSQDHIRVMEHEAVLACGLEDILLDLLAKTPAPPHCRFDRFRIGQTIVDTLRRLPARA